ncbi:PorP/SprF family type IX secretion system membrane protein [Roseivirga echinicomitans]
MKASNKNISIRFALVLFALAFWASEGMAQQVPLYNQYFHRASLAYPSVAAFSTKPELSVVYRRQFSDLEGAPESFAVAFQKPFGDKMGFGLNVIGNSIGIIRQTRVQGAFGYSILNQSAHKLSIGAMPGLSFFSINEDIISSETLNDPVLQNLIGNNGTALSIDLSLSYRYNNFGLDVALPNVVNESLSDDEYIQFNDDNVSDYIAGANYRFAMSSDVYLTPNVTWRYRDVIGSELDMLARLEFKNKFEASIGYRNSYGASVGAGIYINPNILFMYNYDFGKADVPFLSDGLSEFGLHFSFEKNQSKQQQRYAQGEMILNQIRVDNTYDRSMIPQSEQRLVVDYLASLESTGSKKEKLERADARFDEILQQMKDAEQARLQASFDQEARRKLEVAQAEEARVKAEQEAEAARLRQEQAAAQAERDRLAKEQVQQATVEQAQNNDTTDDYLIVVASYSVGNRYGKLYLEKLKAEYPNANIFTSQKRKFDYLYIESLNDFDKAIARMKEITKDTRFANSWVHIVRLSS